MPAVFNHASGVDDEDAIGMVDGGKAVRHGDDRPMAGDPLQGSDDRRLGSGVQRRRRLVQDEDRRIAKDGARDCDALALAARQPRAQFARRGVVAARQAHDQVMDLSGSGGSLDLGIRRVELPHADVVADRRIEEKRVLEYEPDLRAE